MKIEISAGELADRFSILQIKAEKIKDPDKLKAISKEMAMIFESFLNSGPYPLIFYLDLYEVNNDLWDIENKLREHEARKDFGEIFVNLARQVYHLNDKRAEIKRKINEETNSNIVEVKELPKYDNKSI